MKYFIQFNPTKCSWEIIKLNEDVTLYSKTVRLKSTKVMDKLIDELLKKGKL